MQIIQLENGQKHEHKDKFREGYCMDDTCAHEKLLNITSHCVSHMLVTQ